tara:strand:- start:234 stop:911 length:678 start_codon:yes stop_codon:yes gene_type:complete
VTKLIITENLISDINQIKSEINIDESIVSISQEEFTANNTAALFQSDNFQFVSDSFVTYSDLKKMNYDFNEKYIFQVKKNNLKTFSAVAELIETHYPENKKSAEIYPWDLVNIIFSKQKKLTNEIIDKFCNDETVFRQFLSYFNKELQRLLLIYKYDEKKVAEVLSEKVDYKYELAQKRRDKLNVIDLENSLSMIYKIEKLNTNSSFNQENAKRFVVSIKNLLQF